MKPELYKHILDNLARGIYCVDQDRTIIYWNRGAERISGFLETHVLGRNCGSKILRHISQEGTELCHNGCPLELTLRDGIPREAQVLLHHKEGHRVPVAVTISCLRDDNGDIIGAVEEFSDATNHFLMQCELNELKDRSRTDPLTGLGNRIAAEREFKHRLSELKRLGKTFGLLFIDIDKFKEVNDTYGHVVGDRVLVMVAKTLGSALRGIDSVYRWGGEEFVALVPQVNQDILRAVADRMRRFIEVSPLCLDGNDIAITISVGGALSKPDDALETLVARADAMMYKAKRSGRNCTSLDCGCEETS